MKKVKSLFFLLFCLFFVFMGIATAEDKPVQKAKALGMEEAGKKVLDTVNKNFVPQKNAVLSGDITEENGLFKVDLSIENNTQSFYLTKDGQKLIFPNGSIDIGKYEADAKNRQEIKNPEIPKAEKPSVELFVMSLCPYGVKAEKEILPLMRSFGDSVNFKLKFITNIKGDTINGVDSLHGNKEAREDARQAAIMKYYPDRFGSYIEKIDKNSCLLSCGSLNLEDYWKKAAKESGISVKKVEAFAYGQEGFDYLKQNEADTKKYQVNGSPTLVINGVISSSVYEGPEAVKKAVCSSFVDPADVCPQN